MVGTLESVCHSVQARRSGARSERKQTMGYVFGILAVVQLIMHYIALLGMAGGVLAFVVGNVQRGKELFLSGLILMIAKYVLGAVVLGLAGLFGHKRPGSEVEPEE